MYGLKHSSISGTALSAPTHGLNNKESSVEKSDTDHDLGSTSVYTDKFHLISF